MSCLRMKCGRQHYDNDNSQCRPRDFGWKLRGARRISREYNYSAGNRGLRATVRTRRVLSKHQGATHRLSHLRHRLPLINDNTGVCSIPAVTGQRSKEQTTSAIHCIVVCLSYEPISSICRYCWHFPYRPAPWTGHEQF
jgi:hypothetical protein